MKIRCKIVIVLFCCIHTAGLSQTTISGSFLFEGLNRTYRLYIPAVYNANTPVPLVLNLHGYGSNNVQQEFYGDFRLVADTANFILVHPNGTVDGNGSQFWNSFGGSPVNDVGFLSALIDTVKAGYNIDDNCIYSTGMSNGGFMSYELACFLSNRIAAIASVTGSMIWPKLNSCNPVHPVPVMQIHGTADATVPYLGSTSFVPIDSLVRYWAAFNNCSLTPVVSAVPNVNLLDNCTAERQLFDGGSSGSTVELYKVIGGGHTWPGAVFNINVTNMDFSASVEIWRFFRKYKLNLLTNLSPEIMDATSKPHLYPNPSNGNFEIDLKNSKPKMVRVFNNIGQLLHEQSSSDYIIKINMVKPGHYSVVISDHSNVWVEKVIVN